MFNKKLRLLAILLLLSFISSICISCNKKTNQVKETPKIEERDEKAPELRTLTPENGKLVSDDPVEKIVVSGVLYDESGIAHVKVGDHLAQIEKKKIFINSQLKFRLFQEKILFLLW